MPALTAGANTWEAQMSKQPSPIEEISTKPRICINRHEAHQMLKAHGIDKYVMPLIDMLIQSNKSQSETIKTLKADNLQLMQQIEAGGKK